MLLVLLAGACPAPADPVAAPPRPKKVFAHYMGCWPLTHVGLQNMQKDGYKTFKYDSPDKATRLGGHVRNYDLTPPGTDMTLEQSADLEMRRAMRIGIDGFAVDAWAGGDDARRTLDAMFKVAEAKDYPFELTVCLDPCCGGDLVGTVKELLQKHGTSPKLARRDGKPLVFGYLSACYGIGELMWNTKEEMTEAERKARADKLRLTPEGWEMMGQQFDRAIKEIGQPIAYHYSIEWFFMGINNALVKPGMLTAAADVLAKHVHAIGGFFWFGDEASGVANAIKAHGGEWSHPVGMFQKENIPFELWSANGTEAIDGCWEGAIATDSRLIQIITWNDYGENTNIAPALNTRYTLYDLNGYYITKWKTGKAPETDHDRIYLTYHKYPKNARIFPFRSMFGPHDYSLEVLTILLKPATIRLPGRNISYEAPAGLSRKKFPLAVGPVRAELIRDGKTEISLESPEPITDRPFREDNGLVCWSTEDARYWKADFGDTPPCWYSEYGDPTGSGLPNWFRMYYYGKWLDFTTGLKVKPTDEAMNGKTVLQNYLDQTDPTEKPAPEDPESRE